MDVAQHFIVYESNFMPFNALKSIVNEILRYLNTIFSCLIWFFGQLHNIICPFDNIFRYMALYFGFGGEKKTIYL